ncbi:hypothetical protein JMJ35_002060 [Cladonia borealis]|uniref:Uncharacterized protein n=1 Tax=Cladonia borealis TaxID=184061 RepID=A0AA39UDZ8_9LECA|nr:hypothetical protein JMJ35_002060 [Cladonia borealis]
MYLDPNAVLTAFIQIIGLTAAIVFGVFSALSWSEAVKASYEAAASNTIAMFALCSSQNGTDTDQLGALCLNITKAAGQSLSAVASSLFPLQTSTVPTVTATGIPSGAPTTTSAPSTSHTPQTVGTIIGIVFGAFTFSLTMISMIRWCHRHA